MPLADLEKFLERKPALRAERALHQATVVAIGVARLKRGDHERIVDDWKIRARPIGRTRRRKPSKAELIAMLEGSHAELISVEKGPA